MAEGETQGVGGDALGVASPPKANVVKRKSSAHSVSVSVASPPKASVVKLKPLAQVSFKSPESLGTPWFLSERHYKIVRVS